MKDARVKKSQAFSAETLTFLLYWLAIIIAVMFAYNNILPYSIAVKWLFGSGDGIVSLLSTIPIIGGFIKAISSFFGLIFGGLLWAFLQIFQLYPIFLRRDRRFMQSIINSADAHPKYAIRKEDDPVLQALKRWFNSFPTATVSQARFYALIAYAIDFCVCLLVYPPVTGGFDKLMFIIITGQFNRIDWRNVWLLLLTIYTVEALVIFILWLRDVLFYIRSSK